MEPFLKFAFPIILFSLTIFGAVHYFVILSENKCDMTYMFEAPEYLKLHIKYDVVRKVQKYELFVYGEGRYADDLRNEKYNGIPVLFIPGNAGSHRQVRSFASVALRMQHSLQLNQGFNFFTIDFAEEISGLFGGVLEEQTKFVRQCIKHIQSLYKQKTKVLLIGHSMGGVVAKGIFSLPTFRAEEVSMLITLASPHKEAVFAIDSYLNEYYNQIRKTWKYRMRKELSNIPIISIGGGERDYLVKSDLTLLEFEHPSDLDFHSIATTVPGVWCSTDHLAIVWCKQLVLTVIRSLFDLVDVQTKQLTTDRERMKKTLHHHYISRSAGKHYPKLPFVQKGTLPLSGEWIRQETMAWRFTRNKVLSSIFILAPLAKHTNAIIVASGVVKDDWIFGCTKLSEDLNTCLAVENLSNKGEVIPAKDKMNERRMINLEDLFLFEKKIVALVVYITPVTSQVTVIGENYKYHERHERVSLTPFPRRLIQITPVRIKTISLLDEVIFYNITVSGAVGPIYAADFYVENRYCKAGSVVGEGYLRVNIPWSNEDSFYHVKTVLGGLTHVPLKVNAMPPKDTSQDINIYLILDPECSVTLFARYSLPTITSEFVKFYGLYIPGYVIGFLLLYLSGQLYDISESGLCTGFYKIFGKYPTFFTLVVIPTIFFQPLKFLHMTVPFIPEPDDIILESSNMFYIFIVRSLLYLISCGMLIFIYMVSDLALLSISMMWIKLKYRSILEITETPLEEVLKAIQKISKLKLIWCAFMAAVACNTSSSLAIFFATVTYFHKLLSMHSRCKAEEERRGVSPPTSNWYFHFTLTLLLLSANIYQLPGLISWVRTVAYTSYIPRDSNILSSLGIIFSLALLWQFPAPYPYRVYYKEASHLVHFIAALAILYGVKSAYRMLTYISLVFMTVCFHQLLTLYTSPYAVKLD